TTDIPSNGKRWNAKVRERFSIHSEEASFPPLIAMMPLSEKPIDTPSSDSILSPSPILSNSGPCSVLPQWRRKSFHTLPSLKKAFPEKPKIHTSSHYFTSPPLLSSSVLLSPSSVALPRGTWLPPSAASLPSPYLTFSSQSSLWKGSSSLDSIEWREPPLEGASSTSLSPPPVLQRPPLQETTRSIQRARSESSPRPLLSHSFPLGGRRDPLSLRLASRRSYSSFFPLAESPHSLNTPMASTRAYRPPSSPPEKPTHGPTLSPLADLPSQGPLFSNPKPTPSRWEERGEGASHHTVPWEGHASTPFSPLATSHPVDATTISPLRPSESVSTLDATHYPSASLIPGNRVSMGMFPYGTPFSHGSTFPPSTITALASVSVGNPSQSTNPPYGGNTQGEESSLVALSPLLNIPSNGMTLPSVPHKGGSGEATPSETLSSPVEVGLMVVDEAICGWKAKDKNQLSVQADQKLYIVSRHNSGWTYGFLIEPESTKKKFGWFPSNICRSVENRKKRITSKKLAENSPKMRVTMPFTSTSNISQTPLLDGSPSGNPTVPSLRPLEAIVDGSWDAEGGVFSPNTITSSMNSLYGPSSFSKTFPRFSQVENPSAASREGNGDETSSRGDGASPSQDTRSFFDMQIDLGNTQPSLVVSSTKHEMPSASIDASSPSALTDTHSSQDGCGATGRNREVSIVQVIPEKVEVQEVRWDWNGELADGSNTLLLKFRKGEKIEILAHHMTGWIFGRIRGEPQRRGWFPDYMLHDPDEMLARLLREANAFKEGKNSQCES
ncbi:hypothetical protein IE077_001869, partial [Cardiosporidium cionae]